MVVFLEFLFAFQKTATHLFFAHEMSAADMIGCALFFVIVVFRLNWSQIPDTGVWALFIVKRDVIPERSGQVTYVCIAITMGFLHFQAGKKGFHWSVVIGNAWSGKRLLYSILEKQSSEFVGCILRTSVAMKKQAGGMAPHLKCVSEC